MYVHCSGASKGRAKKFPMMHARSDVVCHHSPTQVGHRDQTAALLVTSPLQSGRESPWYGASIASICAITISKRVWLCFAGTIHLRSLLPCHRFQEHRRWGAEMLPRKLQVEKMVWRTVSCEWRDGTTPDTMHVWNLMCAFGYSTREGFLRLRLFFVQELFIIRIG